MGSNYSVRVEHKSVSANLLHDVVDEQISVEFFLEDENLMLYKDAKIIFVA